MGVKVTSTLMSKWLPKTLAQQDAAVAEKAVDIHRQATILAPVDTGALRNSGRIRKIKQGRYEISFGGGRIRYAKRRHYENRKHPSTLKYLERAGDNAYRTGIKKYLKGGL